MKKLNFIMGLVLVLFASLFVASCNNDDEESLEQEFAHVLIIMELRTLSVTMETVLVMAVA